MGGGGDGQSQLNACWVAGVVLVPFLWVSTTGDFVILPQPQPWNMAMSRHVFVVTAGGRQAAGISCMDRRHATKRPSMYRMAPFKESFDSEMPVITLFYGWKKTEFQWHEVINGNIYDLFQWSSSLYFHISQHPPSCCMTPAKTVSLTVNRGHSLKMPGLTFHLPRMHLWTGGSFLWDAQSGAPASQWKPVGVARAHLAVGVRRVWGLESHWSKFRSQAAPTRTWYGGHVHEILASISSGRACVGAF